MVIKMSLDTSTMTGRAAVSNASAVDTMTASCVVHV